MSNSTLLYNKNDLTKFSTSELVREMLEKTRAPVIEKIDKNKNAISKINEDIEKLLLARNALLRDNLQLTSNIVGSVHFLDIPLQDILNEFKKSHFESDKIKRAVSKVRLLFFDDENELYQKYNCVDIKRDDYCPYKLSFVFSNGERDFDLNIPVAAYSDTKSIQQSESCGGGLYLSFYRNSNFIDNTTRTLDIDKFRKDIYNFMSAKSVHDFKTDSLDYLENNRENSLYAIIDAYMNESIARNTCRYTYYENDNLVYTYTKYT